MNKKKFSINEQKSTIGFVHGSISIIGGIVLAYLSMMLFSKFMPGDYGIKIVPSIVLTPIVMSLFGLWLLFSKSILHSILKLLIACSIFILILKVM